MSKAIAKKVAAKKVAAKKTPKATPEEAEPKPKPKPAAAPKKRADIIGEGKDEKPAEAPSHNFGSNEEAERVFAARFREIYDDIADCKDDLKVLRAEAKLAGVDCKIVERAVREAGLTEGEREAREEAEARAARLARVLGKEWAREKSSEQ